jgi:endonuclease/exonuclease/phosphatase family metal-dependent hydrolase
MSTLRLMTYNVRHGQGIASPVSLVRTARAIDSAKPDIVTLNELYRLPGRYDQPARLGKLLGMHVLFHSCQLNGRLEYGNAILSRWPLELVAKVELPKRMETRGVMIAETELEGTRIQVGVTHLSLHRQTRAIQLAAIAERFDCEALMPAMLCGDMNAGAEELGPLEGRLHLHDRNLPTYPSYAPFKTYDHILWNDRWELGGMATLRTLASDHLPLYADFTLRAPLG